jgi:hypothetical protein
MSTEQNAALDDLEKTFERNVFVMMRYRTSKQFVDIEAALREALTPYNLLARFAKDAALSDDLWDNVKLYMHYSRFGIAVFEEIEEREFNPNISLELGYMYALKRRCLLLKDRHMRPLPTDTCGKIYRNFDSYALTTSIDEAVSEWCTRDLGLGVSGLATRHAGQLMFDSDTNDVQFSSWSAFDTTRHFERHIQVVSAEHGVERPGKTRALQIQADATEFVGVNKKLRTLFGKTRFTYTARHSEAPVLNLYFVMIPMQREASGDNLQEVGGTRIADPDNAYSPYRKRYYIPHEHIGDGVWHEGEIDFDFRGVPTADYSIFAARINEGCPKPAGGSLLFRSVKVISYEVSQENGGRKKGQR